MIVYDESEYLESDFTDKALLQIQALHGPTVKDWLLLPGPVPLEVQHDNILAPVTKLG